MACRHNSDDKLFSGLSICWRLHEYGLECSEGVETFCPRHRDICQDTHVKTCATGKTITIWWRRSEIRLKRCENISDVDIAKIQLPSHFDLHESKQ